MDSSFDANITGNLFENNTAGGIQVYDSEGIRTFRNAFADNYVHGTSQVYDSAPNPNAWDDGYPQGGNGWSNYRGADQCSGPGQGVWNGPDGIGDNPYPIQVLGAARARLMKAPRDGRAPRAVGSTSPPRGGTA